MENNMAVKRNKVQIFGDAPTHDRYQALLRMLCAALEHHKLTGEHIGYNVQGQMHPEALTRLLPASKDDRAATDSAELIEQIKAVLADEEIQAKYGVYDVVYNFDDAIEPRYDFYIVPVPVGRPAVSLNSFLNKVEQQ